nr:reverse transcriptase domain-containing protein [Tanacetum cinerariifolium]
MSGPAELNLTPPTSAMRHTLGKEKQQTSKNTNRPASDATLREYCDKHYHQLLPIIAEKVHNEKVQQEKLKEVKSRLSFEGCSRRNSKIQDVSQFIPPDHNMSIPLRREFASNTSIGEKIDKIERQICEGKLRLLDNDENPLVLTGFVESDSEVDVVFDETANLRIPTSGKDVSDKGYGTNSLLEQWRDSYLDNDDYDPYDDDMYENHDLSEHLQSIFDDLDIKESYQSLGLVQDLPQSKLEGLAQHVILAHLIPCDIFCTNKLVPSARFEPTTTSQYSESRTPNKRGDLRRRLCLDAPAADLEVRNQPVSSLGYGKTDLHHLDADREIKEEGNEMCSIG